jgi:hypothetical protein
MTDAPERIWAQDADPDHCDYTGGGWWDAECGSVQYPHMVEYIRADIAEAERKAADELANAVAYLETADAFGGTEACILDALNALKAYRRAKAIRGRESDG